MLTVIISFLKFFCLMLVVFNGIKMVSENITETMQRLQFSIGVAGFITLQWLV